MVKRGGLVWGVLETVTPSEGTVNINPSSTPSTAEDNVMVRFKERSFVSGESKSSRKNTPEVGTGIGGRSS